MKYIQLINPYSMKILKKLLFKNLVSFFSLFLKPRKNTWLISINCGGGSSYAENCLSFAKFLEKKKKLRIYLVSDKKTQNTKSKIVKPFTFAYFKAVLFSKYLVVENDLHNDIPCYRNLNTYKINLFHGLALKKIYYSSNFVSNIFKKNFKNYLKKVLVGFCFPEEYNLIVTSNSLHKKHYTEAFNNKNVKIFFQPRNINLIKHKNNNNYKNKIKKKFNINEKKTIITYLPTFRDTDLKKNKCNLGSNEDFQKFIKKNDLIFISKHHNFYNNNNFKSISQGSKLDNIYNFSETNILTQDLLLISDLLITDYSGVFFDYLILKKPIIFYCYDYYKYLKRDRELYFDYLDDDITPGSKVFKYLNLKKKILENLKKDNKYKKNLKKAQKIFHENLDINSSKKIFNFISKNN